MKYLKKINENDMKFVIVLFFLLIALQSLINYLIIIPFYFHYNMQTPLFIILIIFFTISIIILVLAYWRCYLELEKSLPGKQQLNCSICFKPMMRSFHSYRFNSCVSKQHMVYYIMFLVFYIIFNIFLVAEGLNLTLLYSNNYKEFNQYLNMKVNFKNIQLLLDNDIYFPLLVIIVMTVSLLLIIYSLYEFMYFLVMKFLNQEKGDSNVVAPLSVVPVVTPKVNSEFANQNHRTVETIPPDSPARIFENITER